MIVSWRQFSENYKPLWECIWVEDTPIVKEPLDIETWLSYHLPDCHRCVWGFSNDEFNLLITFSDEESATKFRMRWN